MTDSPRQKRVFHTVLVANRGEIALRVLRTVRRLGYGSVAIYSDVDRDSPHVQAADRAVHVGPAAARASYLNIDSIIEAARRAGADAIHPGYGFLAENGEFADAVTAAGLVFIGPTGDAIRAMGNKAQAKRLISSSGMPCIPGYQGTDQSDAAFTQAAASIGFPVMVKAAAGGGGRGMRRVAQAADLPAALGSARSEALQAFGSNELILERAVSAPRHVEIQVLADAYGHCIHLGERDCSVQRRHQKVIEEAPSPAVDDALRARMADAAVKGALAIGYVGAGTMEFLLDRDGQFYFMEMNTRLQVEHAVTEAITGLDLVEWQLRVAAGERLALLQQDIRFEGHAMEVRLAAEDVAAGFLPQTGPVLRWRPPACEGKDAHDVRVDHALREGGSVPPDYDSMVAKLVAHGRTRDEARRKLLAAVRHCVLLGLPSNQGFLADCLADPVFADGSQVNTGFVDARQGSGLLRPARPTPRTLAYAALACLATATAGAGRGVQPASGSGTAYFKLALDGQSWEVQLTPLATGWQVTVQDAEPLVLCHAAWLDEGRSELQAECDGMMESIVLAQHDGQIHLFHAGRSWCFDQVDERKRHLADGGGGAICAPLTGRVIEVMVREGETVTAGQSLMVLEAMKMEHTLTAPRAGRVEQLSVQAGGQATKGALLLRIEAGA